MATEKLEIYVEPGEPIRPLPPELREGWMENDRLIRAEKDRIEAAKKLAPKPKAKPDEPPGQAKFDYDQQDSAA